MQRILSSCVLLLAVAVVYGQYLPPVNVPELCKEGLKRMGSHFIRHPNNCSVIYNCDGDLSFPIMLHCQYPLVFSQSQQVCVYKDSTYDDCSGGIFLGGYNSQLCTPKPDGMNRDPNHCNRFIPCWKGNAYPSMPCQGNLLFDFRLQRCVEPGKTQCVRNQRNPQ